jgi:pimeloyl-ACP methyl ester carboxylesterase
VNGLNPVILPGPDGGSLAMHDLGGSGPNLLIAHATGLHGWIYRPFAAALIDRFHCWAFDLRGHGDSTVQAGETLDWSSFGRDVLAAVSHLGPDPVVGFGHSLGGAATLLAAQQDPTAFDRLVLYEPAILPPGESTSARFLAEKRMMVDGAARRRADFESKAHALLHLSPRGAMSTISAASLEAYVTHGFSDGPDGRVHLKCRPSVESTTFAQTTSQERWGVWPGLGTMRPPLVIVHGTQSGGHHRLTAEAASKQFGTPLVVLDGLGHFGPLQVPGYVAEVVGAGSLSRH